MVHASHICSMMQPPSQHNWHPIKGNTPHPDSPRSNTTSKNNFNITALQMCVRTSKNISLHCYWPFCWESAGHNRDVKAQAWAPGSGFWNFKPGLSPLQALVQVGPGLGLNGLSSVDSGLEAQPSTSLHSMHLSGLNGLIQHWSFNNQRLHLSHSSRKWQHGVKMWKWCNTHCSSPPTLEFNL